ncbi:MAG TPA: DNA repair protein RecO [Candidatus Omnitrophota bacterium]|nr:DNA repair protein RecO [Candidatus Omnitrophota bacterium]
MSGLVANGIILRKYLLRETSYILVIFTKEFGKIRGVLKGVRDPYPQFAGNFEIFTQCSVVFYRKKKSALDLISRCEMVDFFYPARKDIERLTYSNYFIELVDTVSTDHDPNEGLYGVLLDGLRAMATDASPKRVARIFEIKFLSNIGFEPDMSSCVKCSSPAGDNMFFSAKSGGLLCATCAGKDAGSFAMSAGAVNFIKKIQETPFSKTMQIKVAREVGAEIEKALKSFMRYHLERETRSMRFLEDIEKRGLCDRMTV